MKELPCCTAKTCRQIFNACESLSLILLLSVITARGTHNFRELQVTLYLINKRKERKKEKETIGHDFYRKCAFARCSRVRERVREESSRTKRAYNYQHYWCDFPERNQLFVSLRYRGLHDRLHYSYFYKIWMNLSYNANTIEYIGSCLLFFRGFFIYCYPRISFCYIGIYISLLL